VSFTNRITFAIAVNDREMLERNFLVSPCLKAPQDHEILLQSEFRSAALAYNDAIDRAQNDLIIFCHQDILLPEGWLRGLGSILDSLDETDPNWGVLGPYGKTNDGRGWGHVYSSGRGVIGEPLPHPVEVQTLDEIVLILRKSSGLRFDDSLPHFHFYGADICLRAAKMGMKSYAVSAFCIHNTIQPLVLPGEFYECASHIRKVWGDHLPIQTTCVRLTRFGFPVLGRRLREFHLEHIRHKKYGGMRLADPLPLLSEFSDRG